ncbi:hypothetical protein RIF29_20589 [Crotalaria pallida]|uniref:Uncharacterized protein n=1 Tax=Crotalaria pallida TaxID=3830 RepID=A0AAN9I575_CROPI
MTKKKGRPPKSPNLLSKTEITAENMPASPLRAESPHFDEEDLTDIEILSPKQAELWLQKIDALREKISAKVDKPENNVLSADCDKNSDDQRRTAGNGIPISDTDKSEADAVLEAAVDPNKMQYENSQEQQDLENGEWTTVTRTKAKGKELQRGSLGKLRALQKPLSVLNKDKFHDIDKIELQLRDDLDKVQADLRIF